jgi:hypothetical protein
MAAEREERKMVAEKAETAESALVDSKPLLPPGVRVKL